MNRFVEAVKNMFRIEDLRNRVLFTLALLAVYRIGAHIPTPGINTAVLEQMFNQSAGSVLGIFDLFSGGNFRRLTIFALGIMPYITSSIILQLMTVVFPYLERLQKEGELGRRKITQYTRYLTIVLSIIQSFTIAQTLQAASGPGGQSMVYHPGWGFTLMTILTLTTGSAFIMWLGEQISERGIGNGMSLIIFVGIVVGLPRAVVDLYEKAKTQAWGPFTPLALILLIALMIAVVAFIVFVEGGQRRIPVQYAKRVVGRRVMGGQSSYLPLRVNSGGVIPPIFASSLLAFPATAALIFGTRWPFVANIQVGRAAVHLDLCDADFGVRILLCWHRLQSDGARGQHAEKRRIHSGHPSRPHHFRACQQDSEEVDVHWCGVPGARLPASGMDDRGHSPRPSRLGNRVVV